LITSKYQKWKNKYFKGSKLGKNLLNDESEIDEEKWKELLTLKKMSKMKKLMNLIDSMK
jgi:hypothetical protein